MEDLEKKVASIWGLVTVHKAELAGITKDKVRTALKAGHVYGKGGTFLIYTPSHRYMGLYLGPKGVQLGYIASANKGSGEATDLITKLQTNFSSIALMVREDNPRAIAFYKKHGFTQERVIPYAHYNSIVMLWRQPR